MEGSLNLSNNEKSVYYANSAIGIAGGYSAYRFLPKYVNKPYIKFFLKKCKSITPSEHIEYCNKAKTAYENSDKYNTNVKIINIDKSNWKSVADNVIASQKKFIEESKNNPIAYIVKKLLCPKENSLRNHIKVVAKGENACYIPLTSQVLINSEKMGITTFHELGHSINHNSKGFRQVLGLGRCISALAIPFILGVGLLTPKREEGDEYKNPFGKTATFIKEHSGILASLSMLPVIAEEGVADINGAKLAKTVLDKNMYKKLNKHNAIAFNSYIIGAAVLGLCTALAVYIKDRISGTAPVKNKD